MPSLYDPSSDPSAVYGAQLNKSRCLVPVLGDTQRNRFLVGTLSLHSSENEVHLIEYSSEQNDVYNVGLYRHPHEIWSIAAHPNRPDLFFTIYNTGKLFEATLWQLPQNIYSDNIDEDIEDDDQEQPVVQPQTSPSAPLLKNKLVLQSNEPKNPLHCVLWDPSSVSDRVLTVDSQNVKEWRINQDMEKSESLNTFSVGRKIGTGRWNPHHNELAAVAAQTKIIQLDLRTNKTSHTIENAHEQRVRDFEYNPYKPYFIASGGDDCKVKFWDVRSTKEPVLVLCGHSHWVTNVKFNPHHDQLLLSCSTDSLVNLWSTPTVSSKSTTEELDEELEEFEKELDQQVSEDEKSDYTSTSAFSGKSRTKVSNMTDSLVQSIDEHEESVYSVAWSSYNSWIFGSVSYDGRVLMHHVKQSERLKILDMSL